MRTGRPSLCVSCGVWLPGLHDTMPLSTGQPNFPSHLTSVTAFIIVLHSLLHSSGEKMKKWVQSSRGQEQESFFTASSGESVSLETLRANSRSLDAEVIPFQPRFTLGLLCPGDHFTPHFKYAAVASPLRPVNKGTDKGRAAELLLHNRLQLVLNPNGDEHK